MNKLSEDEFKKLTADGKINYIRGFFRNSQGYCEQGLLRVMRESRPDFGNHSPGYARILEAFIIKTEGLFGLCDTGGDALAHLPQHGYVSQTEYELLYAEAGHLAGVIFDNLGFKDCGNYAHSICSRHLAMAKKTAELLREHLAVYG